MKTLRVGTRSSALALKQTELVIEALKRVDPAVNVEVVGITTKETGWCTYPWRKSEARACL